MKITKRAIAAILTCVLALGALVPGSFAAKKEDTIFAVTTSGTVAFDDSKTMKIVGYADDEHFGDYYMESSVLRLSGDKTIKEEVVNGSCGNILYIKMTDPDTGKYTFYYYDGANTYYSGSDYMGETVSVGGEYVGNYVHPLGETMMLPDRDAEINNPVTTGTATIYGKDYYCEILIARDTFGGECVYCYDGDTLKYFVILYTNSDGSNSSTNIHEVKTYSQSCDVSQFGLPAGFPDSFVWKAW